MNWNRVRILLKKIILGSVLTSAVLSSTAFFSINASKQNFANQNKNTSSFKDIYTQKGEPSIASVNKLTPAPNALTNKANSNKWNQQMTPYVSKIKKPVLKFVGFKEPSSPTATDGKAWYKAENYDSRHIVWGLFHQGPNSDTFNRANLLSSGNGAEKTLEITDLKFGDEIQLNLAPKNGYTWNDGTTDKIFDPTWRRIGKQVKKPTIHYLGFKGPSSSTAADGELYYNVEYFNSNIQWGVWSTQNVNLDMPTRVKMHYLREKFTLSNIKIGDDISLQLDPKQGYVWDDGTTARILQKDSIFIYKDPNTVKKPKITQVTKKPTTTTSTDGEVTYTLTNFDPKIMKISLAHGSKGNLGTFNSSNNTVKVTGLKNGQKAQIKVEFKKIGTSSLPRKYLGKLSGFGVEDDNTTQPKMHPKNFVSRVKLTLPRNSALEFQTVIAASQINIGINPTFEAIHKEITDSNYLFGFLIFDKSSQKITYNGKNIEGASNAMEWTLDSKNSSGNNSQIKFKIWVENFNKTSREISLAAKLWLSIDGTGEDVGIMENLFFKSFSNLPPIWEDQSTKPIYSTPWTASQTYVGIIKPTFTKVVKQPTTTTSTDGEVTYTLTNFDPSKMTIALVPGSSGTLGTYDPTTKQVKVIGLKVSQHAQIQVVPKNNKTYLDGTRIQKSSTFTPAQTYVGFAKTKFTKVVKQPTIATSSDGEVTYTLTNFDPSKMSITLTPGSSGTLGTYDPTTKQVKVTGLKVGQHTQIQVILKTNEFWLDGTLPPQKSSTFTPAQTYLGFLKPTFTKMVKKQPTTTTSTDGEVTYILKQFLPSKMSITLAPGSSGILETYDPTTKQVKVIGLKVGQHAQIQAVPKNKESWFDGTWTPQKSSTFTPAQTYVGFAKTKFTKVVKQPTTTSSTNGEVTYTLINFDPSKMTIALVPSSSGTLGTYDPTTKQVKVISLKVGQYAQIQVVPKNKESWFDGTWTPQKSSTFTPAQTYVGIIKPTFTKIVKQPTTTSSTNGEVTYTLTNFDPSKMSITLTPGSSGTLGTYDPTTKQVKVTKLANGERVQIQIHLKNNELWTDGKEQLTIESEKFDGIIPLPIVIPLFVLLTLISIFSIYAQRFHWNFKYMKKSFLLNLWSLQAKVNLIFSKIWNCFFKKK